MKKQSKLINDDLSRIPKPKPWDRVLKRGHYALLLLFVMVFITNVQNVQAEGSKDLYPSDALGSRAYLRVSTSESTAFPFPTLGTHYVYAKVGETIAIATDAQKTNTKRIFLFSPTNVDVTPTDGSSPNATRGNIPTRAAELAGPRLPGVTSGSGYTPIYYTVPAGGEGIYRVEFRGGGDSTTGDSRYGASTTGQAANSWPTLANNNYLVAWDISVAKTDNSGWISGRVFTNVLNMDDPSYKSGTTSEFATNSGFYGKVKVLTRDGFVYNVNNNGMQGISFTFMSNNIGFHVAGDPSTQSYQSISASTAQVVKDRYSDPRQPCKDGIYTQKIFYNLPNDDMPAKAKSSDLGGEECWLKTVRPNLDLGSDDVTFVGADGSSNPWEAGSKGGYFVFKAVPGIKYNINIVPDNTSLTPRILKGTVTEELVDGEYARIYWDGKDGGSPAQLFPVGENPGTVTVGLEGAEVHFPYIDVELNKNGIIIQLLKANGDVESDIVYWDDTSIGDGGGSSGSKSNPINNSHLPSGTGLSSATNGHIWGTGSNATAGTFGDTMGIDTWTFAKGETYEDGFKVTVNEADLAVTELSPNKTGDYAINENITYTIKVANLGNDTDFKVNAENAPFHFVVPEGFEPISGTYYTFDGDGCGNESSGKELVFDATTNTFKSELDLPDGCEVTYTITLKITEDANLGAGEVKAGILRPADIYDPDGTNISDPEKPLGDINGPTYDFDNYFYPPFDPFIEAENNGKSGVSNNIANKPVTVVEAEDLPPVAIDDYLTTPVDTPVSGNILTNDSGEVIKVTEVKDAKGNTITIGGTTPQEVKDEDGEIVGTIIIDEDGSFTFTPEDGFTGEIPLDYTITDENDMTDDAKLVIKVIPTVDPTNNNPPIATDDNVTGPKDTPITGNVKENDYDPDGDDITVTKITVPNESGVPTDYEPGDEITIYDGGTPVGKITVEENGDFSFTPEDPVFTGKVPPINYTVCDDKGGCDDANLNITIIDKSPSESAVYAEDDYNFQNEDDVTPMTGEILKNDVNTGTGDLTVSAFSYEDEDGNIVPGSFNTATPIYKDGEKVGELTLNPDGTYSFDPEPDFVGTISIPYTAKNDDGETDDATLYLTRLPVLTPPVAIDDYLTTPVDTPVSGNILTNDSGDDIKVKKVKDAQGNTITIGSATPQDVKDAVGNKVGTITIKEDGSFTFTPEPNFTGEIPLDYTIEDENDLEDDAKLVINVIPAVDPVNNNPPIATDDNVTGPKDTPITGKVTDNDYDPDEGDEITVTKITVLDDEGKPTTVTVPENGDPVTTPVYDEGGNKIGELTIDKEGNFTFTPEDPNFTGNVPPINYTVCDDGTPQECDNANLNITIIDKSSTESAVYAEDDYKFQNEDETDPMEGNILTNDTNTGTDPLTVSEFTYIDSSGTPTTVTTVVGTPVEVYHNGKKAGELTLNPDGTYSFDPEPDFVGTISIPYTAKNDDGETDDATLYLTRLPVLEAPVAKDDINQTPMNTAVSGDVLTNDTGEGVLKVVEVIIPGYNSGNPVEVPAGGLTGIEIKDGANTIGTISINQDGSYIFTPLNDFVGTVPTIAYKVEDENGLSDDATLAIEVLPVVDNVNNNPPTARDDKLTGKPTEPIESNITGNDNDPDGDPIKVKTVGGENVPEDECVTIEVKVEGGEVGTLEVCSDGSTTYTPTDNTFTGEIPPISYEVCDDAGECATAEIIITIVEDDGVNSTVANDDTNSAPKGETMTGNVLDNDNDPEGNDQTLKSVTIDGADYPITVGTPEVITITGKGTLTIDDKGKYTFVPEPNFVGTVVVEQTVCDNGDPVACDNATLYLTTTDVIPNYWVGTEDTDWNKNSNWTIGVPKPGKTVEFATNTNNPGQPAVKDLHVPTDDPKVVKDLINESDKALVVPPAASITVTGEVVGSDNPEDADKIVIKAAEDEPNGSFIALDACSNFDVYATVELWAQGQEIPNAADQKINDPITGSPTSGKQLYSTHSWQHFGVPVEQVLALDAFEKSWIQKYSEPQNGNFEGSGLSEESGVTFYDKWNFVKPYEVLNMFEGYEITQKAPTRYTIQGKLFFCDMELTLTRKAVAVAGATGANVHYGLGQNVFGNSYTAAIDVDKGIEFIDEEVEKTVYIYRTGSFQEWSAGLLVTTDTEPNAGSYIAIPVNTSDVVWDRQIPSLQGFLLKFTEDETKFNYPDKKVKLLYANGGVVANTKPQLAEKAPLSHLTVTMSSKSTVDRVWLFSQDGTSNEFDNGWDGTKYFGTPTAFIYSESSFGPLQVNTSDNLDGKVLTILPNKDTNYTLTLNRSNLDDYSDLHLVDLVTRTVTPLSGETTTYNFTANHAGQRSKRFVIVNSNNIDLDKIMSLDGYLQNNNTLVVSNLTSKAGRAYLYDVSGKALMNEVIQPSMNQFPVSLQSGVYILTMEAAGIVESVKLIVK